MTRIISIDGNIGSGKSTLVSKLKEYYEEEENCGGQRICFLQEPVDIWNTITDKEGKTMIECYYADSEKYAFPFQMMAYISRLATLKKELKNKWDIIFTERCVYTDRNVFAKMLYDDGKINEIEYKIYNKWFDEFIEDIPNTEFIYLQSSPEVAFERIKKRARTGENIPLEYLTECNKYHETWLDVKIEKCLINGNVDTTENPEIIADWIKLIDNYTQVYTITFDGASRGNPGPCGAGFVIWKNKEIFKEGKHFVSKSNTNNYAEYCALLMALKACTAHNIKNVIVKGDSELVIKQINKEYKITSQNLILLHSVIMDEIYGMNYIKFIHISREKNGDADRLANLAINKWGKGLLTEEIIFQGMELNK